MAGRTLEPLFRLRVRTPRLELRLPSEPELRALARLAEQGVHPPEQMPFLVPWTDEAGSPTFVDGFLAYHRGLLEAWQPDDWHLELGVWAGGELAGVQGLYASEFRRRRTVATGSCLGQRFQGRGYGTEVRAAVLQLAFAGLGALAAESGSLGGNVASERVSEKLGYARSGERTAAPRGTPVREQRFRLEAAQWARAAPPPVEIVGLDECLALLGAGR